jgi:hypothetical protein
VTIHFALAEGRLRPRLSQAEARAALVRPANDNRSEAAGPVPERELLHAALRQFAQHGIGAAEHARGQAERAFFAGDRDTYRWWLGVCRTLDRRLAATLASQTDGKTGAKPR